MKALTLHHLVLQEVTLKLIICLVFICPICSSAQTDFFCKTNAGENILAETNLLNGADGDGECPEEGTPLIFEEHLIKIYVHILRREDGTGGQSEQNVLVALDRLKQAFDPFNIHFVWDCQINYIDDDDIYNEDYCPIFSFGNPDYEIFEGNYIHPDGIDIFLFSEQVIGCGRAKDIVSTAFFFGGQFGTLPGNSYVQTQIISHEMGHCLGLYHTFHGTTSNTNENNGDPNACQELVNGDVANRSRCGDYVCDTPADPQMSRLAIAYPDCEWPFPWPDANSEFYADADGDLYDPDGRNIMAYSSPKCNEYFTDGQGVRMSRCISISPILDAVLMESQTISIDKTWTLNDASHDNGEIIIYDQLIIESGATLRIENGLSVRFKEQGKLIIQPDAELILEGTLTNSDCSPYWQGIEVWGGGNSQYAIGGTRSQGRLVALPGSVVENAITAVKSYGPTENEAGGQIYGTGATFRNNQVAVAFKPFENTFPSGSQAGQPRNYFSGFSDCTFLTNDDYPTMTSFDAFITMTGINGLRVSGCTFQNEQNLSGGPSVVDYGYGIKALEAGFRVEALCTSSVAPCTSFDKNKFIGLGYGIYTGNITENRPFTVKQAEFENCYFGIFNSGVSNSTVLFNTFNLGEVPNSAASIDQFGVFYENRINGFTLEENTFTSSQTTNGLTTVGIYVRELGEFNNLIRKNSFSNLTFGNVAEGINAPMAGGKDARGLHYLCNQNTATEDTDFSVVSNGLRSSRIRSEQGLVEFNPFTSTTIQRAAGNSFSYTGTDFGNVNISAPLNYHYYNAGSNEKPMVFFGLNDLEALENTCPQTYCDPPCMNASSLAQRKASFYLNRQQAILARAARDAAQMAGNTSQYNAANRAVTYHQQEMDKDAYIVVLHASQDTINANPDTMTLWYGNLNTFSSDLTQAIKYQIQGQNTLALTKLTQAANRTNLGTIDLDDLLKMSSLLPILNAKSPFNLDLLSQQNLDLLTPADNSLVGNVARNILLNYGYYFPPVYHLPSPASPAQQATDYTIAHPAEVTVYPNPTAHHFNFIWNPAKPRSIDAAHLSIIDLTGRILEERIISPNQNLQLDLRSYGSGLYFYRLQMGDQLPKTGKLILE